MSLQKEVTPMSQTAMSTLGIETIVNYLGGGVFCCKNDGVLTIAYASTSFYSMFEYSEGEITALNGPSPNRVLSSDQRINWGRLAENLKKRGLAELELKLVQKSGNYIWAICCLRLMIAEDGSEYFCGILEDVTKRRRSIKREREQLEIIKKAKRELANSEERYRIIMEQAADPICDYNFKTQELYCSPPFKEKFGLEVNADGLLEQLYHSDIIYEDDKSRILNDVYSFLNGKNPKSPEYRFKDVNGAYRWYRVRSTVLCDEQKEPLRMIAFISDIDRQKRETMSLKEKAEHDQLTGLYNRMTTNTLIDKVISQSSTGSRHALFTIDIDNFKNVNDNLGHLVGDEVIVNIASKIKKKFREDDIIGRIGGDEFVVFLTDISRRDVERKADVLQTIFRNAHPHDDPELKVSGSIGVAFYPEDGTNYYELFSKADAAMYAAKNSGKDAYRTYADTARQDK
ncbi:sensor domain-containing diguanylate cyclase [Caproiciproducens faecalis]|uniref:Diguanylate cyclase n=1 Tax=Caproiciproducens faecalis TaxID=2820301 RepID=A0ABS7DMR1_9FIRM|nr:diguanylate cyclase [Caproiciproducens faecalis]